MLAGITQYRGPRPAPSRRWVRPFIISAALLALADGTRAVLNLIERHYQQQIQAGSPPSPTSIRSTLDALGTAGDVSLALFVVFVVTWVGWTSRRRTKARVRADGEEFVEPPLKKVWPTLYWSYWVAAAVILFLNVRAASIHHPGMTRADFVEYRTYLAAVNAVAALFVAGLIAMAVRATRLQERREAQTDPPTGSPLAEVVGPLDPTRTEI